MQLPRPAPLPFILLLIGMLTGGCSLSPNQQDRFAGLDAEGLYQQANGFWRGGNYDQAIEYFDQLLATYPFGEYAQQSYIEKAYAQFKSERPNAAIATLNRFLKTYPRHPNADYAQFLKSVVTYERQQSLFQKLLPIDAADRDPKIITEAFQNFSELVRNYPDSQYTRDGRQRMVYLRETLARHELNVANWYMRRGAYLAAAKRAGQVIERFQGTPVMEDALQMQIMAYEKLGLDDLRAAAIRVLKANYPTATTQSYTEQSPSLMRSLINLFSFED